MPDQHPDNATLHCHRWSHLFDNLAFIQSPHLFAVEFFGFADYGVGATHFPLLRRD
jgi:hypothetical protein